MAARGEGAEQTTGLPDDERNSQSSVGNKKPNHTRPSKRCRTCEADNAPAAKKCCGCGVEILRKKEGDSYNIGAMGKTNPTKQFNMLKHRAKILNYHHDWHVVVLACHKHGRGHTFNTFATPGLGEEFIGTGENRTATGKAVLDVFRSYTIHSLMNKAQENGARNIENSHSDTSSAPPTCTQLCQDKATTQSTDEITTCHSTRNMATSQSTDKLTNIETNDDLTTTHANENLSTMQTTNEPTATMTRNDLLTNKDISALTSNDEPTSTQIINDITTIVTNPTQSIDEPNTTQTTDESTGKETTLQDSHGPPSLTRTTHEPSATQSNSVAVTVIECGKVVGVGWTTNLTSIHGHPVPGDHHCVLLTWALENHPAPCPLGRQDLEENMFLHKDMFYAIPHDSLKRFVKNNNNIVLLPFT